MNARLNAERLLSGSLLLVCAWAVACTSAESAARPDGSGTVALNQESAAVRLADDVFDASCCSRRDLDLNRDGKSDAYQFTRTEGTDTKVLRKEVDVNFDGRIDLVVFFERGNIVRKENDTNFDTKPDVWRFFDKGNESREERDSDYNGKVDYWEYFEGGKLDRAGTDKDGDGNVDEWLQVGDG